jgi:PAS domain S-box-containing protein
MADKPTQEALETRIKELEQIVAECNLTEEALKESEERYRTLYENIPVGVYRASPEGKILSANPAALEMFGFDLEDISNFQLTDIYNDPKKREANLKLLKAQGSVKDIEVEFKRKDGTVFWGSINATLVKDKYGRFIYSDGIIQDISERKLAEEKLIQEKTSSEAILNSLPGVFYLYDENRQLIKWNRNMEVLTGYSTEELDHMHITDFFESAEKEKVTQAVNQVFQGKDQDIEVRATVKNGLKLPFLLTGTRLCLNNKNLVLGLGLDITDRLKIENALKDSERRLADIIEFLPDATYVIDMDGNVVAWNRAIEELSGVKAADIIGKGNYEYAIPFYGTRRPVLADLTLKWDDEIADKYAYVKQEGDVLISETINPPFKPTLSLFWNSACKLYNTHGDVVGAIEVIRDITHRIQAEESLRRSEKMYRGLFENTGTATFVAEADMTISQVNAKCEELIGYTKAEIEGKMKTSDFVSERDLARIQAYHIGRRKGEKNVPSEYELELIDRQGQTRNAIIQVGLMAETQQSIASLIDITALRKAEQELRTNESRFRSLVANIPGAVYRCDRDSDWTMYFLSDAIMDICGYPASDFISNRVRTFTSVVHPDDRHIIEDTIKKRTEDSQPFEIEYRIQHKDGHIRWVYEHGVAITGKDGSVQYLDGAIFDITERKLAEEALREKESRYRTLFNAANDTIFTMKDDVFVDCNLKTLAMFGCERHEIIGKSPAQFSPTKQPDGSLSKEKAMQKIKDAYEGEPQVFEWRHKRKDGSLFDVVVSLNRVELSDGPHLQAIVRDITDQKRVEKERQQLQKQLIQAQKMEAIGTLAGGIAHDFNNILSAIIGFTEISLRDVPPDSKLKDNLQRVLSAGIRAGDLVKQILTFSRQTEREIKPVQIKSIAKEALKLIRASLPATIEVVQDIHSESPILADPTQIHQIIMNLCTNAAHAMQENGGKMRVSMKDVTLGVDAVAAHPEIAPGVFIKLSVTDSGSGIASESRDRIFDPFFTTKKPGQGTGLGLSVVHGIIKDCGGMITVESTPGQGSQFHVFLPVIETEPSEEVVTRVPLPTGTERILLIDDEPNQVDIGQQVLKLLGYSVTGKTNSLEALKLFRQNPDDFDLVVTDMTMPKMTGDELAKEMLAVKPNLPIIICTGYSERVTPAKAKALGIKEMIMKPAVVKEIANTVRRVLDQAIDEY